MKKEKYFYNTQTLRYERLKTDWKKHILNSLMLFCAFLVFSGIIVLFSHKYFPSPRENALKQQIDFLNKRYKIVDTELDKVLQDMSTLRERDANLYRTIYERDPLPEDIWKVGAQDSSLFDKYAKYENTELIGSLLKKIDNIKKRMIVQRMSYREIDKLIEQKAEMLASIPSIQPVSNKDLKYIASGFGYRIHPIYRIPKMHTGIDFTAPTGVDVYATGNGIVEQANNSGGGYGNEVVIDHGYGYKTRYAHLSVIKVRKGQKVTRGDKIGLVGSTGASVGPHLHYEVEYQANKVDPALFFFNDLSDEQYDQMRKAAAAEGQSFD